MQKKTKWWIFGTLGAVGLLLMLRSTTLYEAMNYKVRADDPARAAKILPKDEFGDSFKDVTYLNQGWAEADSLWYYNVTQGSDLVPYDFFLVLEKQDSQELFRSDANINHFRYMPQKATYGNPDALPVGMVEDTYLGKKYMGFSCAACHASQINFNEKAMRIDGGPGAADMDSFMNALGESLKATRLDKAKQRRFIAAVLQKGNYGKEDEILKDLDTYATRLDAYNFFNVSQVKDTHTPVPYGYARLDAFGRIYNRVLEHVLDPKALTNLLKLKLTPQESEAVLAKLGPVLSDDNRDAVMAKLIGKLDIPQRRELRDKIFNSPNAPVSYPFLWDISRHDYVQWNGIGANAGAGPVGRNVGEVIGVFGTLDWQEKKGWTVASMLGGQGLFSKKHVSFQSSVNLHNVRMIEDRLSQLMSPQWTEASEKVGLPKLDATRVAHGAQIFDEQCAECHATIERDDPARRIVANMTSVSSIRTDPTMAENGVNYAGNSGFLRNWYMKADVGGILLNTKAPVAALLTTATENVVATPDPDKWPLTRLSDWAIELVDEFRTNQIKPSVRAGNYTPDVTNAPFGSLKAYKGRSLNGIWATAPYLHNGSVPTLYDLLLPARPEPGDPAGTEYRPAKFLVGSRELDADKVGFKSAGYPNGFLFDTTQPANSNAGHEYGTRPRQFGNPPVDKPALTPEERRDLLEYLKSL